MLIRHGSTAWSVSGRHTGRTDVPLLPQGEADAYAVGRALVDADFALVLSSPLQRARRTAELAGLDPQLEGDLMEWDYGGYEGLTTAEIRSLTGRDWTIFTDGVVAGATPGESLADVIARTSRVLTKIAPTLAHGDVALVAHGHTLRVLATVFLALPPAAAGQLLLDAGSISVLEMEKELPAIRSWNDRPERTAYASS